MGGLHPFSISRRKQNGGNSLIHGNLHSLRCGARVPAGASHPVRGAHSYIMANQRPNFKQFGEEESISLFLMKILLPKAKKERDRPIPGKRKASDLLEEAGEGMPVHPKDHADPKPGQHNRGASRREKRQGQPATGSIERHIPIPQKVWNAIIPNTPVQM